MSYYSIVENFKEQIKPELDRRIHLITTSVMSSFLSGDDPSATSIRHVLNRVMILLQMPLCFLIFKKEKDKFVSVYNFNRHPRDQIFVAKVIEELPRFPHHVFEPFQMFGFDYYLVPVIVGKNKNGEYCFSRLFKLLDGASPQTTEDLAAYQLNELLSEKHYSMYFGTLRPLLLRCIENPINDGDGTHPNWILGEKAKPHINEIYPISAKEKIINSELLREVENDFQTVLLKNKDFELSPDIMFNGNLDRIFRKIGENLRAVARIGRGEIGEIASVSNLTNEDQVVNYVIFARDYAVEENYIRCRQDFNGVQTGMNYHVRIELCSRQKKNIRNYFENLRNKTINEQKKIKIKRGYAKYIEHPWARKIAEDLDDYFWNTLNQKKDPRDPYSKDGIDSFIEIIGSKFGRQTRSISDHVFDSGVVHFRKPFTDGGISRSMPMPVNEYPKTLNEIENSTDKFGKEVLSDLKRLVICFYWYHGMTGASSGIKENDEENVELGIMMVPIEIGRRIWAIVGYFTLLYKTMDSVKKDQTIQMEYNTNTWTMNYHIFQDVNDRVKKDLRHSVSESHRSLHGYYYGKIFSNSIIEKLTEARKDLGENNNPSEIIENWINIRYRALATFFSYDLVSIKIENGRGGPRLYSGRDEASGFLSVAAKPNSAGARVIGEGLDSLDGVHGKVEPSAGAYLVDTHHAATALVSNPYFPHPIASAAGQEYNFVSLQDIEIRMSYARIRQVWRNAHFFLEQLRAKKLKPTKNNDPTKPSLH